MTKEKDIVVTADPDAPEILEDLALDQPTGGAQYGSSNSCEPVRPRLNDLFIKSWSFGGVESADDDSFRSS